MVSRPHVQLFVAFFLEVAAVECCETRQERTRAIDGDWLVGAWLIGSASIGPVQLPEDGSESVSLAKKIQKFAIPIHHVVEIWAAGGLASVDGLAWIRISN